MNRTLFGASALTVLLASASAFAASADQPGHQSPKPGTNSEAMSAVEDTTAGLVGKVSAEMTSTTKGFVQAAATSDMYEVAAGKIALQRSHTPAVRDFAQKMVEAHTATTSKLKGILASNNINVAPPAHVDDRRQGMLDNLRGASASEFDNRYIAQQIAAHEEADILFRGYAKDGDNAAVRNFAAKTDADIKDHLDMANQIDRTLQSVMARK